jgi:16S rRNA (adenine1518-N6/adenine1519-N6)-dimethyltransferase
VRARKRFGQNFLIDETIVDKIVGRFDHTQTIVEIGPGRGALTEGLLKTGANVIALELDRDLIPLLEKRFDAYIDFQSLAANAPLRLVGNLPYNVATPLIFRLLEHLPIITDMHFMLQWEVAARLAAQAGDRNYGQLSVVMHNLCQTQTLIEVPPAAFNPVPKVNSAVIQIAPRQQPLVQQALTQRFEHVVKSAFAQRRKTLRNNLKGLLDESQITAAGVNPGLRAEVLTLEQFAALAEQLDA